MEINGKIAVIGWDWVIWEVGKDGPYASKIRVKLRHEELFDPLKKVVVLANLTI
jgi:hypothetical protein